MDKEYLAYKFEDSPEFINTFDELPLWSAPFGLMLLDNIELKPNLTVLDIGSGAGFPLLELAQRLGPTSTCYGLDPWTNANNRVREKIKNYGLKNVNVIDGNSGQIPLEDAFIDLIVSNLGINNFEQPWLVIKECHRVLKPGGKLALTTNLNGHWKEFYKVFEEILREAGHTDLINKLKMHQEHRGSIQSVSELFSNNGFHPARTYEDHFTMKFLNGTAFLNHHFIKLGWLISWKELIPENLQLFVFSRLEENLNALSAEQGLLNFTVPMAFIEGKKL